MISQENPSLRKFQKERFATMREAMDLKETKETVEDILSSYETRIENITSIFEVSQSLVDTLPESLLGDKKKKEKVTVELKDLLARNDNLRKKDFDKMMDSVSSFQEECGEEMKDLVREYFDEERGVTQILRKALKEFKDALARGEIKKIKNLQLSIKELFAEREKRKSEIVSRLKEFQGEQEEIPRQLTGLLAKGEDLRIRDFKSMLSRIKTERVERLSLRKKRKEDVTKMLQDFKRQRQRLAFPPKAIDNIGEAKNAKKS